MIRKILIPTLFLLFTFASCEKTEDLQADNDCIKVKLIAEICGTAVLQIQDSKHFDLGENNWSLEVGTTKYDNVFFTVFSCEDMEFLSQNKNQKTFNVKVNDKFEMGNCAVCLALIANPPSKKLNISIAKTNCPPVQNG